MSNNSNSFDLDGRQVRDKTWDNDVVRATVLDVLPDIHAVRVNPRGDDSPLVAPVLTPHYGSVTLPSSGERVTLVYIAENVPVVIGSVYLTDGQDPPDVEPNHIRIGNENGYIGVDADGNIVSSDPLGYSDEDAQDATAALLSGGSNITTSYDDPNDTLTIDTSALNEEEVQDTISALLTGGTGVSLNYDDANDTLTINGFSGSHNDLTDIASDDHHTRYSDSEAQSAAESVEKFSFTAGHTEWGANVSNEEVHRINLQSGEALTVQRVDTQLKGGGTDSNLSFDVYDNSAGNILMSSSAGSPTTGSATSSDGAVVLIRITNNNSTTTVGTTTINGVIA